MTDLTPIFEAVRQAAELCHAVQQQHIIRNEKTGSEPVTIADYGSQAILCRTIQQHFPNDGIMSEESGTQFNEVLDDAQRTQITELIGKILGTPVQESQVAAWLDHGKGLEAERIWVIDPIDGTKGFLAQAHYVVAVGILDHRKPTGAVIAAPAYPGGGLLFFAQDGKSYKEPLDGSGSPQQIHVSNQADPTLLRALESVNKSHGGFDRMAKVRMIAGLNPENLERADSMEKYCRIAAGDAEVYLRLPRQGSTRPHSIWDHAPGVAMIQAAGGMATDVDGSPLDFSEGSSLKNMGVVASNGPHHQQLIAAVQQMLSEEANS